MDEIIRLENVIRMYPGGRRAVNGVSLCVRERESLQISGAPGSGKTTLLRLIAGMDAPSAGALYVSGKAVHEMDAGTKAALRNRTFGLLPRDPALLGGISVLENVALPLVIRAVPAARRKKAAMEQLATLDIAYAAQADPAQLSAYERQLVSLARALAAQPLVLLLDEPAADLSEREAQQFLGIVSAVCNYGALTSILCTAQEDALPYTGRHLYLRHGKIGEDKP